MATSRRVIPESMTVEEYLEFEEQSDVRHEYVAGGVYAFAGVTRRHSKIVTNLTLALGPEADLLGCELHIEAVKLKAAPNIMYYPDIMVVCDPDDDDRLIVSRPCLVIEVLSPSTETTDLREKTFVYRNVPSLQTILLVRQDQEEVIHHYRTDADGWKRQTLTAGSIEIPCLNTELSLDQIYRRLPD